MFLFMYSSSVLLSLYLYADEFHQTWGISPSTLANIFSAPFSLPFPSGTSNTYMVDYVVMFHGYVDH